MSQSRGPSGPGQTEHGPPQRDYGPVERARDHAAIAESLTDLMPALIAKLGATGLAELEVREDALRIRLRRPIGAPLAHDRRAGDRSPRPERSRGAASTSGSAHHAGLTPVGPGRELRDGRDGGAGVDGHDPTRGETPPAIATSPAVGIYHPASGVPAGKRVRAGDRLGTVDMLGVPQEVVAPVDGVIGASLVDSGDAVEYGQELVLIEFAPAPTAPGASPATAPGAGRPPAPGAGRAPDTEP